MQWTADVTKALVTSKDRGDKKALKTLKKKQVAMLNKFSEATRTNLTKIQRAKIVGLVTIEVHARDIIDKLIKIGCNDVTAFDWLSQLRTYWDKVYKTPLKILETYQSSINMHCHVTFCLHFSGP